MKKVAALIAIAGLASAAMAQPGSENRIRIMVRAFGTNDAWSSSLTAVSGSPGNPSTAPIEVEVGAFFYRSSGYGFSTSVMSIIGSPFSAASGDSATILDNTNSALHPDGRIGGPGGNSGFNNGGQFQVVYATGTGGVDANRFRIAASGNAAANKAGGISIKQGTPAALGTNFDTSDGNFAYHFKLTLACYGIGTSRTVTVDAPVASMVNSYTVYPASTSTTATSVIASLLATAPASINVSWIPAPASLALLGLGGLVAGRRRR
jgi:hypothetical protein